jgi:hypothetical protein
MSRLIYRFNEGRVEAEGLVGAEEGSFLMALA